MRMRAIVLMGAVLALAGIAHAQWNPPQGQWGKTEPTDVRVMTWNVRDTICSSNDKIGGTSDWGSVARIIALLKPDILIIQEAGDNSGNGTGSGVDSPAVLANVFRLLIEGGNDPYNGNVPITGYVQAWAPGYYLPYVYVNTLNDGFNRNMICSRWPFADLNGDSQSVIGDISFVQANAGGYAQGGNGGIRGFAFAEIDLPDETYLGDMVMGCVHMRSGGAASDLAERLRASTNVAYYIDHIFNGGGQGIPDPFNQISDSPQVQTVLGPETAVIWGGDLNEDELTNGRKGPAEWLTQAQLAGGTDGTDRDRSDSTYDSATDPFTGVRTTQGTSSKLDYLCWQDSIATARRQFVFYSVSIPISPPSVIPPEFSGLTRPRDLSPAASDHRPVIIDFILPLVPPCACDRSVGDTNDDCQVNGADLSVLLGQFGQVVLPGTGADLNSDGAVNGADLSVLLSNFGCQ